MTALRPFIETAEQQAMIDQLYTIKELVQKTGAEADRENRLPMESIQALLDLNYNQLTLPAEYGGKGFGIYGALLCQETLASFDGPTALSIGWHIGIVGEIYSRGMWSAEHLAHFAEALLEERAVTNRVASEVITGSPTRGGRPGTNATRRNGQWELTGRKSYTSLSYALTHYLVSAWIEEKQSVGFFLVDSGSDGVSIEETWDMVAMRGTASHDLVLDNVTIPEDALVELNDSPRGTKPNGWMLHIPAVYLGIAQAARDHAIEFARTYQPNSLDTVIGELPHVQDKIGQIELKLLAARHSLYGIARQFEREASRDDITVELGAAKHIVVNAALDVVDLSMRIVGAKSLQSENPLNRFYRDVRAGLHNPPMDDMTVIKLAQKALAETRPAVKNT